VGGGAVGSGTTVGGVVGTGGEVAGATGVATGVVTGAATGVEGVPVVGGTTVAVGGAGVWQATLSTNSAAMYGVMGRSRKSFRGMASGL
jgi:hypothetical protein